MTIVLIATDVWALGGVRTVLLRLAEEFRAAGLSVRIVSLSGRAQNGADGQVEVLVPPARWESLLAEQTWERLGLRRTRRLRLRAVARRRIVGRVRELAGDGLVLALDLSSAEALRSARRPSRCVVAHHGSFAAIHGTRDERRLRRASAGVAALVALTETDAAGFRRAGFSAERILAIPNSVTPAIAAPVAGRPFVLAAGRFHPQKAFDVLLDGWARTNSRTGHRLVLVGAGPLRRRLTDQRRRLGLDEVDIRGESDVRRLLADASLLVLSSRDEGMPMVVLEAMSAGVPVVATDCAPGVRELLDHPRSGVMVPVDDPRALAAAVDQVLADSDLADRLGQGGREGSVRFAPAAVVPQWLRLFDDVLRASS